MAVPCSLTSSQSSCHNPAAGLAGGEPPPTAFQSSCHNPPTTGMGPEVGTGLGAGLGLGGALPKSGSQWWSIF